mmetsp:Transcript_89095/g.140738  ORF Transcript_89095/g.140738 Transcript_89095/m.140738 type:complete len:201 (-) Transcript_89095:187-789(-)
METLYAHVARQGDEHLLEDRVWRSRAYDRHSPSSNTFRSRHQRYEEREPVAFVLRWRHVLARILLVVHVGMRQLHQLLHPSDSNQLPWNHCLCCWYVVPKCSCFCAVVNAEQARCCDCQRTWIQHSKCVLGHGDAMGYLSGPSGKLCSHSSRRRRHFRRSCVDGWHTRLIGLLRVHRSPFLQAHQDFWVDPQSCIRCVCH